MNTSATNIDIDRIHNIILGIYFVLFLISRANQIQYFAKVMADALAPQTPPKKLFKASSKTKTPTRPRPSSQLAQYTSSAQKTPNDAPRSVVSESPEPSNEPFTDRVAKSTNLAPLTNVSVTSDELAETAGSDTTGLVDNYVLTPADTASRGTGAHSPLSREPSQSAKGSPPSFKNKLYRAKDSAKESADSLVGGLAGKFTGDSENTASNLLAEIDSAAENLNSPADIAKYFKDQGFPEMSSFVTSLTGSGSHGSGENTPRAAKPSADGTQSPSNRANQVTNGQKIERLGRASSQQQSRDRPDPNPPEPADASKTADGTFRDTGDNKKSIAKPTNKMGEPNVSNTSQTAHPAIPSATSDTTKRPHGTLQSDDQDSGAHEFDNMGRPTHVERSFEIPFQRLGKKSNSPPEYEKRRRESNDLGDYEDLPSVDNLPSTDDLPAIPDDDSQDPPEELLDPSVHATSSSSITPIPKIPKIPHIDSSAPAELGRLAQGLAGHVVDDVGNIVDESGEVLGHVTGDLPAMVGKKVSDDGEIYGDGGEIVGYVSQNFVNPPSPTEIPGDLLGRLRVDHQGNILDSDGKIIGKFNEPPKPSAGSTSKAETGEKSKEEQKPKVNAHTGGSPSDLFLDVKSTTDGIQLTIRIPTTFSRQPSESH
ncbi:hypothetical protein F4782DRAFT_478231 [Xylaria castorea]|nr:hypothetical protein F4782DRAFT_478231 [Xylaria castorea]